MITWQRSAFTGFNPGESRGNASNTNQDINCDAIEADLLCHFGGECQVNGILNVKVLLFERVQARKPCGVIKISRQARNWGIAPLNSARIDPKMWKLAGTRPIIDVETSGEMESIQHPEPTYNFLGRVSPSQRGYGVAYSATFVRRFISTHGFVRHCIQNCAKPLHNFIRLVIDCGVLASPPKLQGQLVNAVVRLKMTMTKTY